jgi:hypothetical protein
MPLRKSRITEEQIRARADAGGDGNACNRGVPGDRCDRADLLSLEESYGGLGVHEIRRLKLLGQENRRLKQRWRISRSTS